MYSSQYKNGMIEDLPQLSLLIVSFSIFVIFHFDFVLYTVLGKWFRWHTWIYENTLEKSTSVLNRKNQNEKLKYQNQLKWILIEMIYYQFDDQWISSRCSVSPRILRFFLLALDNNQKAFFLYKMIIIREYHVNRMG